MMKIASGLLVATILLLAQMTSATAQAWRNSGTLRCALGPSMGFIIGSHQQMECRFYPRRGPARDRYAGTISRIGLDLGFTRGGQLVWGVFARSTGLPRGALAGTYVGASGDVAFGAGVGANVLIGGFNRSVMLQPVSVSGQVGVNVALGVAGLELVYRR